MSPPRRPVLALDDPLADRRRMEPVAAESSPYEGAPSRQFNTRLLVPLHERYARLVRQLADDGFETTVTEIVHALFHEGPSDPAEARALVRRWRVARHATTEEP
jgi:hypothetical protein